MDRDDNKVARKRHRDTTELEMGFVLARNMYRVENLQRKLRCSCLSVFGGHLTANL